MVYKYNKEAQEQFSPQSNEPFLNLDKDKLFALDVTKDGDYRIRLMTYWSPKGLFALGAKVHFKVGAKKRTVICPDMTADGMCPFCRVQARIRSEKEYKADSDDIRVKFRYYSNIVDMKNPQKGVLVWSYGPQIFFPIKKFMDNGEYGDLTDPLNGRDLIVNRQVRGRVTDAVYPAPNPSPIQDPNWLEQLVNLDTILPEPDPKLVEELFASHPWKVWEPEVRSYQSTAKEPVKDETKPASKAKDLEPQPKAEQESKPSTLPVDQFEDLRRRLTEKMSKKGLA